MARNRTDEELILAKRARELQGECAARGEEIGYQQCLGRAAQERGKTSYEAALAGAREAEAIAFIEQLGALGEFADLLGEAAKAHQRIVQKAHTDTASLIAASEKTLLQYSADRRNVVDQAEEAWRLALAIFPELSDT